MMSPNGSTSSSYLVPLLVEGRTWRRRGLLAMDGCDQRCQRLRSVQFLRREQAGASRCLHNRERTNPCRPNDRSRTSLGLHSQELCKSRAPRSRDHGRERAARRNPCRPQGSPDTLHSGTRIHAREHLALNPRYPLLSRMQPDQLSRGISEAKGHCVPTLIGDAHA